MTLSEDNEQTGYQRAFQVVRDKMNSEQAQNFLELILKTIPDVIFVKDADMRMIAGNPAFFQLFPEDQRGTVLGTTGTDNFNPEEVVEYLANDREALEKGKSVAVEDITVANGKSYKFQSTKIRFEDTDGNQFILGLARDITEAQQSQKRLEQIYKFQNLMLQHIPNMMFVKDEDFRIVQANDAFLRVYPEDARSAVIGSTTLEQYKAAEREAFLKHDKVAFETGFSRTEESIEFPDGERRTLMTKKVKFEDEQGAKFILGIATNISELVEARSENELYIELLNTVFNTVTGAVIGLNAEKQVLMINNAGRHMLTEQMADTPFAWPNEIIFLDPADMQPLEASHDPVARALVGQAIGGEVHLMTTRSSGDSRYVRVTSAVVQSKKSPLKTVIVLDDVSEAERNRQHLERQSRLDALGQLTGGIAHDFNNLLNTMQYALELIRRDNLSERGQRSASAALKSISRGSELTNRLLAFAKKQPSRSAAQSLRDVFSELRELVGPAIEASLSVEFKEPEDGVMVFCDQGQLQNAVLNLILNSRDAIMQHNTGNLIRIGTRCVDALPTQGSDGDSNAAPPLVVSLEQDSDDGKAQRFVEITVSDNGPGMSAAVASRALDPFFTTKGVNSGTGLGLSMVYGFVQQAGGDLRIYTEEGEGTAVKLYIPRGSEETGLEAPVDLAPLAEGNGETILIVEDEEFLLEQLNELLKELNYNTLQASNGRAALALIEEGAKIDLIVTDVVMPGGIGGFELARRAREIIADVPIIYMSGYTGFTDEEMGEVVAPLLPKPSSPSMTASQIRAVLDAKNE